MQRTKNQQPTTRIPVLITATIIVGIGVGLLAMLLVLLLHAVQHIAYGYSISQTISNTSFLAGVSASTPLRRVMILMICGLIAGCGWYLLYRYGKPLVSIKQAVQSKARMPYVSTIIHALLQICTIALGSPLGREVAPREVGAVFATWLSTKFGLYLREMQIMLACGAGAGLAVVYNVPFGGAIFAIEVLLCSFNLAVILPALATSGIAVAVSWLCLDNVPMYHIAAAIKLSSALVIWSIMAGPIFGFAAFWFMRIANIARSKALHDYRMLLACCINFTIIGVLAIYFPVLLGNGKSPVQLEFDDTTSIELSVILLALRMIICWSSLRVGAQGGLLTPSLANGALMAVLLGSLGHFLYPSIALSTCAIIGAAAFLASAQKMPITAIALILEMTQINISFIVPIVLAVAGSIGMDYLCENRFFVKK